MAQYSQSSPYKTTTINQDALDVMTDRTITKYPDDPQYTITIEYALRPDKLAYNLYGDAGLWWVFTQRNPNVIEDPIFDFQVGTRIYIPRKETLEKELGI